MNINHSIPRIFEDVEKRSKILSLKDKKYFFDKNKLILRASKSLSERISEINKHYKITVEINTRSNETLKILKN